MIFVCKTCNGYKCIPSLEAKDAKPVIAALRRQGVHTIGFAGFCWIGKLAVELAKTHQIHSALLLHPVQLTFDDIKKVKVPIAILGAELDTGLPPLLLKQFQKIFLSVPKIDNKVVHGFTLRYNNVTDAKAVKIANEAHQDMINWFIKHDLN